MANFCPECGSRVTAAEAGAEEAQAAEAVMEDLTASEVRIAEINADKEIRLAKIAAGIAESEAVVEAAHAEGRAEGMETVIEAASPEPEPSPEPVPVIVDPEPEPAPDMAPPDVADDDGHQADKPKRKSLGLGVW